MPRLHDMFQRPTLDPEDLYAFNAGVTPVTIARILEKPVSSHVADEMEFAFFVEVEQFLKPFKLNPVNGRQLAEVLGSDRSEVWVGKTIGILACKIRVPDVQGSMREVWVVNVAAELPKAAPSPVKRLDITGLARDGSTARSGRPGYIQDERSLDRVAPDMRPLGVQSAAELCCLLAERDRRWDDLRCFLLTKGLGQCINGVSPPDCPNAIRPAVQVYLHDLPVCKPKPDPEKFIRSWVPPPPEAEPLIAIPEADIPF